MRASSMSSRNPETLWNRDGTPTVTYEDVKMVDKDGNIITIKTIASAFDLEGGEFRGETAPKIEGLKEP